MPWLDRLEKYGDLLFILIVGPVLWGCLWVWRITAYGYLTPKEAWVLRSMGIIFPLLSLLFYSLPLRIKRFHRYLPVTFAGSFLLFILIFLMTAPDRPGKPNPFWRDFLFSVSGQVFGLLSLGVAWLLYYAAGSVAVLSSLKRKFRELAPRLGVELAFYYDPREKDHIRLPDIYAAPQFTVLGIPGARVKFPFMREIIDTLLASPPPCGDRAVVLEDGSELGPLFSRFGKVLVVPKRTEWDRKLPVFLQVLRGCVIVCFRKGKEVAPAVLEEVKKAIEEAW
ncbi:hypothetical protein [Ammonifex thiophilus]|uniref:Uncharacterized protein n=1 Tax=Ammonifex thiophilus TaxID=444093 RepID=A0A3D8P1B8_9THEO|nr:hypothetical protein [Ammonifex thiophilus]RDV81269.1 hypothetical protein DXX99_09520 [Ammonifex thiophilus]